MAVRDRDGLGYPAFFARVCHPIVPRLLIGAHFIRSFPRANLNPTENLSAIKFYAQSEGRVI